MKKSKDKLYKIIVGGGCMRVLILFLSLLMTSCASARSILTSDLAYNLTPDNSIQATIDDAFTYDWNGKSAVVTVGCGVYFQHFTVSGRAVGQYGNSTFTITGADLTNPTCVVIFADGVDACVVTNGAVVTLVGIQCQTSGANSNSFVCADYSICTMSFLGVGTSGNYHLAVQNGARVFYKSTTPGFNGGRTKFYVTANAAAARYVTNPGSDLLFQSVDIINSPGLTFSVAYDIFAVSSYFHDVAVTYNSTPITGQKFRAYDHASYSDGTGTLASIAAMPGTGYTIFGCATYNSTSFCSPP